MSFDTNKMKPRQIVLLWDQDKGRRDSDRFVLLIAGYDVHYVYSEAEAFNMADILAQSGNVAACLIIRCVENLKKLVTIFTSMEQNKFSTSVLLISSEETKREIDYARTWVPDGLNVKFYLSSRTLDAVSEISCHLK